MSASEAPASRKNTHVDDSSLLTAWLRVLLVCNALVLTGGACAPFTRTMLPLGGWLFRRGMYKQYY